MGASAAAAEAWGRRARRRAGDPGAVVPRLPGVLEAGRGVAYLAAREAALLACVTGPGTIADCLDAVSPLMPGLFRSGARWTGAGALGGASGVSWFAFEGPHDAALLFTEGPEPEGSPLWASVLAPLGATPPVPWRLAVGQQGRLPHDAYAVLEASRPLPIWDLPGFGHLAPGACLRAPLEPPVAAVARAS
jgi:hypothetical protein